MSKLHYTIDEGTSTSEYRKSFCCGALSLDENSKTSPYWTHRPSKFTRDLDRVTCKRCLTKLKKREVKDEKR